MRDKKSMSDVRAVSIIHIIILFSFTESQERISCMYFLIHEHVAIYDTDTHILCSSFLSLCHA